MAKFTDIIININSEDYERDKRFKIKNIYKVNDVDLKENNLDNFDIKIIRQRLNLKMIESTEILKNKGIDNIKVLCAGDGVIFYEVKQYIKYKNLQ